MSYSDGVSIATTNISCTIYEGRLPLCRKIGPDL